MPSIKHRLELIFDLAQSLVFGMCASAMCLIRHYNLSLNWHCTFLVGVVPYMSNLLKTKEDLIGQLGVCMAPHNCAGVVCRFIGFSKTLGLMASPYMHAAIRRDCDGDEAAIMLLGDVLLNFSRKYYM